MNDEYLQKWLLRADNDLKVAEHEMAVPQEELVTEAVCFHCQQAVEKYLKAYLVRRSVDFGKTHNLEYLVELCSKQDEEFCTLEVGNLTFYAVEVRYPDAF
jgi:HEPN domain-containing protein